jgi:hypothetical protein
MNMNDLAFDAEVADDLLEASGTLLKNVLGENRPIVFRWLPSSSTSGSL